MFTVLQPSLVLECDRPPDPELVFHCPTYPQEGDGDPYYIAVMQFMGTSWFAMPSPGPEYVGPGADEYT